MAIGPQRFGRAARGPQPFGFFGGGVPFSPGQPAAQRYFLNFPGVNQYISIPPVTSTGDFEIECLFYRTTNSGGQFIVGQYDTAIGSYGINLYSTGDYGSGQGRVAIFGVTYSGQQGIEGLSAFRLYHVRFKYDSLSQTLSGYLNRGETPVFSQTVTLPSGIASANVAAIARAGQGGFTFSGITSNVVISVSGSVVRSYNVGDNSDTIVDSVGGNNGTYINGSTADWGFFTRQPNGNWQGRNLTVPPWASPNQILEVA